MSVDPQDVSQVTIDPRTIKVEVPDDQRVAPYSSTVIINSTGQDFLLTFAQIVPVISSLATQQMQAEAHVVARVIMTRQTAVQLLEVLGRQLDQRPDVNVNESPAI